jgi:hypothetical protein
MKKDNLTELDIRVLRFYKDGNQLNGFEGAHRHLCELGYLDDDLELTKVGREYINIIQYELPSM